jgi:hypothetical protein
MKITLPNGLSVEGTQEQLEEILVKLGYDNLLGDEKYYFSDSKGPVLITEMNTMHLRNAILKFYETWVNNLHSIANPKLLVEKLQNGIDNKTWLVMVKEYWGREEV